MTSIQSIIKRVVGLVAIIAMVYISSSEAKLLRRSRLYEDSMGGYDGPYMGGSTGERAIITVRGARNPYDGTAPSKIAIEDNPYRGPYPRGVYDRLDGYGGRGGRGMMPMYPQQDYGYSNGGYGGGMGPMFGAPNRIAVTGAYPYGYGSRYGK